MPEDKRDIVVRHLTECALAWAAWRRGELSPPDYLEAQHSLLTSLALDLAEGVNDRTPGTPPPSRRLVVPQRWEQDRLGLGTARNRVKHRGFRHEAERYVEMYEQCVYSVAYDVTGMDAHAAQRPHAARGGAWGKAAASADVRPLRQPQVVHRY